MKVILMYINPVFANAVNVSGIANFHCDKLAIPLAGASNNDIEIEGTFSVTQLLLKGSGLLGQIMSGPGGGLGGQEITIRPTHFILCDGFLRYDDMQMDVGDHPVNFAGVIGLDKSLDMTVTLPYTIEGRTVTIDDDTSKRVTLPLGGTVERPELDLGRLLEDQLKDQIEQELQRQIEKIFG